MKRKNQQGLTLIELMIAVAIGIILMTMAVPSFVNTVENNRLATKTNEFIADLNLARMEAVKQGRTGYICRSTNGTSCATADEDWAVGWIVWVDTDGDTNQDADELIRIHEALNGLTFKAEDENGNDLDLKQIAFLASGYRDITGGGSTISFTLASENCTGNNARAITIIPMGRANVVSASCS